MFASLLLWCAFVKGNAPQTSTNFTKKMTTLKVLCVRLSRYQDPEHIPSKHCTLALHQAFGTFAY